MQKIKYKPNPALHHNQGRTGATIGKMLARYGKDGKLKAPKK